MTSPSWLTRHPTAPVLYAANESADGAITTIDLDAVHRGGHRAQPAAADPCHLAITADQRFLLCANYSSGSLAVFGLAADGQITGRTDLVTHEGSGPDADRQEAAHVHMAVPLDTPQGTMVSAVDLGPTRSAPTCCPAPARWSRCRSRDAARHRPAPARPPAGHRPGVRRRRAGRHAWSPSARTRPAPSPRSTSRPATPGALEDGPNYVAHSSSPATGCTCPTAGPDCVTEFDLSGETPRAVADHPCGAFPRHFSLVAGTCHVAAQLDDAIVSFPLAGGDRRPVPDGHADLRDRRLSRTRHSARRSRISRSAARAEPARRLSRFCASKVRSRVLESAEEGELHAVAVVYHVPRGGHDLGGKPTDPIVISSRYIAISPVGRLGTTDSITCTIQLRSLQHGIQYG